VLDHEKAILHDLEHGHQQAAEDAVEEDRLLHLGRDWLDELDVRGAYRS
jgi:hypothetical protein